MFNPLKSNEVNGNTFAWMFEQLRPHFTHRCECCEKEIEPDDYIKFNKKCWLCWANDEKES